VPASYPPLGAKYCKIIGLIKAIKTVEEALSPNVSEKMSIIIPIRKARIRMSHLGISNGKNKMNKMKNAGTICKLEIPILLKIKI
jgi:hypothetical protein